jgi:folate-dependent phosphoribosylglycinamide formyltransferase PurN
MQERNLLFFSLSHLGKPNTVIKRLEESQWTDNLNMKFVINKEEGDLYNTLRQLSIPHIVANNPTNPKKEVNLAFDNISYIISCGWGWRITKDIIDLANIASINCHSSLLPDYRGPSVFRAQWAHAETEGGATIHFLNEQFDDGNIICQGKFSIGLFDSPQTIRTRIAETTACLLREAILLLEKGYEGYPNTEGRYFPGRIVTSKRLYGYRILNATLRALGSQKRLYLPHK